MDQEEYKTTFNYLLTHQVVPRFLFSDLDFFYKTIITNPDNMQIFMQNCMASADDIAKKNPDIEPAFSADEFAMKIFGDTIEKSIIVVIIPKFEKDCDSAFIAFPCMREKARYITCELSSNPFTGESLFIMGEWEHEGDSRKHLNYGRIDIKNGNDFAAEVIGLVYGG